MSKIARSGTRVKGFEDAEMDFQLIRQLGATPYGGAAIGECLALVGAIGDGDPASWVEAFKTLARRLQDDARRRAARGHGVSARDQFFRACNAWRAAEYYTLAGAPEHRELGLNSRACFLDAMKNAGHAFEELMIPCGDIRLPAYFMKPAGPEARRKTLLIVSGFDGTTEEEYFMRAVPALQRGYNTLLFAGHGQMDTLRFYPDTHFIPDFERAVSPVLDECLSRPDVDPERVALCGISFGGYFAARAAAHEPRVRALIANSPIVDLCAYMSAFFPFDPCAVPDSEDFSAEDLADIPDAVFPPQEKRLVGNIILRFGKRRFRETFLYMREFVVGDAIRDIVCPCLAMVGEGEGAEPKRQYDLFLKSVSGPVEKACFTAADGADSHCQAGNVSFGAAVMLDWLDETFARVAH